MEGDELVERVARAMCLNPDMIVDNHTPSCPGPAWRLYADDARAAIRIALEEAARVAEVAPYTRNAMVCGCSEGLANFTAAAIRAMIVDPEPSS